MSVTDEAVLSQGECKEIPFPNLLQLSEDLKAIFDEGLLTDIVLRAGEKYIRCHKAILSIRSKWFSLKIRQASSTGTPLITMNENKQILEAILLYIYTGNLKLLEELNIPLMDLRNAADKYGLTSLKKILTDIIKSEKISDKTRSIEFLWSVEVNRNTSFIYACSALDDFNLHGSGKWDLEIQPLHLGNGTCVIGIYLTRKAVNETREIIHIVNVNVHAVDSCGSRRFPMKAEVIVSEDGKYRIDEIATDTDSLENTHLLISYGTITLACELTVCSKLRDSECFQLKGRHQRCVSNELLALSLDMHQMLKMGKYFDTSIQLKGSVLLQVHSYILLGRTRMPVANISRVGELSGFGSVVWRSFIHFLYTGQTRFLDDHMRVIYSVFNKLCLKEPTQKYSKILANNLNVNNAFGILCDARDNGDNDLLYCAAHFLARNSSTLPDPTVWINIASDNSSREIFKNRFC